MPVNALRSWSMRVLEIAVELPLERLVEGEEWWETSDHPQVVLPENWGGTELNHTVTCMVLKDMVNDSPLPR
ncbi:hypothetical protein TNCV_2813261 [Trichonephila clavipes]|nr:hypothetical protein TNCV_2813261 [Trichonephila clavipes]